VSANPQHFAPLELPQHLSPVPFVCLTRGHHAEHEAARALSRMLHVYEQAARRVRKNRGTA
jgi:hypothetical protein